MDIFRFPFSRTLLQEADVDDGFVFLPSGNGIFCVDLERVISETEPFSIRPDEAADRVKGRIAP